LRAYQSSYDTPERPSYEPGYLPSAQESQDSRRAAEERFAESVGSEVFAEGVRLSADYRSAQNRLGELCTDLYRRSSEAIRDHNKGIDNTQAKQAADRAKYRVAPQP
jgi:hypothetical protein